MHCVWLEYLFSTNVFVFVDSMSVILFTCRTHAGPRPEMRARLKSGRLVTLAYRLWEISRGYTGFFSRVFGLCTRLGVLLHWRLLHGHFVIRNFRYMGNWSELFFVSRKTCQNGLSFHAKLGKMNCRYVGNFQSESSFHAKLVTGNFRFMQNLSLWIVVSSKTCKNGLLHRKLVRPDCHEFVRMNCHQEMCLHRNY